MVFDGFGGGGVGWWLVVVLVGGWWLVALVYSRMLLLRRKEMGMGMPNNHQPPYQTEVAIAVIALLFV